jgi:RNA recognition motif-containing protein
VVPFGKITECKILVDRQRQPRGVAFVHFADHEAAAAAIKGLDGKRIGDHPHPLHVTHHYHSHVMSIMVSKSFFFKFEWLAR